MKWHIPFYVTKTVSKELGIHPKPNNRAFHPTKVDIRNYMWTAKKALELSKPDQENVHCKIENWKQLHPNSSFFFRTYIKKQKGFTSWNHLWKQPTSSNPGNTTEETVRQQKTVTVLLNQMTIALRHFYQECWQKELLAKYGNTLALLDTTCKTTKHLQQVIQRYLTLIEGVHREVKAFT